MSRIIAKLSLFILSPAIVALCVNIYLPPKISEIIHKELIAKQELALLIESFGRTDVPVPVQRHEVWKGRPEC